MASDADSYCASEHSVDLSDISEQIEEDSDTGDNNNFQVMDGHEILPKSRLMDKKIPIHQLNIIDHLDESCGLRNCAAKLTLFLDSFSAAVKVLRFGSPADSTATDLG